MEIVCSKTGSDGNFSVIYDGKSYLAIDCGIPYEKANRLCGHKLIKAVALLVTHGHGDHFAYINQYIPRMLNIFMGQEPFYSGCVAPGFDEIYEDALHIIDGSQFRVGTFIIKPFKVPHTNSDGSPCENYGFLIYSTVTKERMLWATDCAYIEQRFPPCEYYCIECNYIDVGNYENELQYVNAPVERRRFASHHSLNRCVEFFKHQDLSKAKFIKLLHLTKNQGIIEDEIKARFAKKFPDIEVIV